MNNEIQANKPNSQAPKVFIERGKHPDTFGEVSKFDQLNTRNPPPILATETRNTRITEMIDLCLSSDKDDLGSSDDGSCAANFEKISRLTHTSTALGKKDIILKNPDIPLSNSGIKFSPTENYSNPALTPVKSKGSNIAPNVELVYKTGSSDAVGNSLNVSDDSGLPLPATQSTTITNSIRNKRGIVDSSHFTKLQPPNKVSKIDTSVRDDQNSSSFTGRHTSALITTPLSSTSPSSDVSLNPSTIINQAPGLVDVEDKNTISIPPQNQTYGNHLLELDENVNKIPECDPDFASRVNLDPVPDAASLPRLTPRELSELELALQIGGKFEDSKTNSWREDWNGNIQLFDKEIVINLDKVAQNPQTKKITIPFEEWVAENSRHADDFRGIQLLFSFVYHMTDTPPMAKRIMAYVLQRSASSITERQKMIIEATRRISYDPTILNQDGWTTAKSDSPDGLSDGAYLIGRRVIWDRYEAIIIAFVRDEEIGDLWKALWIEDNETFDLEADELQEALKKWDRKRTLKQKRSNSAANEKSQPSALIGKKPSMSIRFEASRNFTVDGVEDGIILAISYNGRTRIPWPARIMHVTEVKALGNLSSSRRSSSKNEIHVVFLAPYWNVSQTSKYRADTASKSGSKSENMFSTGPLFEIETIDVSSDTIQKYPHDSYENFLSVDKLRAEFSFLGLPKAAFSRYLDGHRIAISLKAYAQKELRKKNPSMAGDASQAGAYASLTDTHPLSVRTPSFPVALLNLPFEYILSQFPHPDQQASLFNDGDKEEVKEPIMDLHFMMKSLIPPNCWGRKEIQPNNNGDLQTPTISTPHSIRTLTPTESPALNNFSRKRSVNTNFEEDHWQIDAFASEYLIKHIGDIAENKPNLPELAFLGKQLSNLIQRLKECIMEVESVTGKVRQVKIRSFLISCFTLKGHGEDMLHAHEIPKESNQRNLVLEWRKSCERIYKRAVVQMRSKSTGSGVTIVVTDSRCNKHLTAIGSFERPVRLPAAIRGAKNAGTGSKESMPLVTKIESKYMELAERNVMPKAHTKQYLKRMRDKIVTLPPDAKGVPLTDDSEGEGGEDTMGSRGSYTAAVVGVAAALQGVDMVMGGHCVNAFCAVRPPGHHAGRELRAMNAISNGFCIFNAAACAALYATSPLSESGLGLKRVCVIDFDVHHGNGTQNILCSTQDSRFLYISTHAGGAHINGYSDDDSDDGLHRGLSTSKNEGIFPGRCGDTSPHGGVLNIPLGKKVTAQALGMALVSQVTPAVQAFSPELIIVSAGFDAHKSDPLGMGGLSAENFGTVTTVICQMAMKTCSGRVLSILEGGYGVPCCKIRKDLFLPESMQHSAPSKLLDLGSDLSDSMEDTVDPVLRQKLDRCHQEGFLECVKEHVSSLAEHNHVNSSKTH